MQLETIYQKLIETMPNYKVRHLQLMMAEAIDECFHNANPDIADGNNIAMIEAPTGTGKSMAYLLAGIINAKRLGKKLIITTATKALQSQLVEKDIPNLIEYAGVKFSYALAKGRSNYLCPYQLEMGTNQLSTELQFNNDNAKETITKIKSLINSNEWNGDFDTIPLSIDATLKSSLTIDKDRCLGSGCAYNQEGDCRCPFYLHRQQLKFSDVIVTNHSLLLADLHVGAGSILGVKPENYLLCIDEGHNLSDVAIKSFSSDFDLKYSIGICQNLLHLLINPSTQDYVFSDTELCKSIHEKLTGLLEVLEQLLGLFEQNIEHFTENKLILNSYLNATIGEFFHECFVTIAYLGFEVNQGLSKIIEKIKEQISSTEDSLLENNLNKLGFYLSALDSVVATSHYIINQDDSKLNANAKWIELRHKTQNNFEFNVNGSIIHCGQKLFEELWSKVYACVITSATLAINNDFKYYLTRLGLNEYKKINLHKIAVGFNYKEQAQIVVPRFQYAPEYNSNANFQMELDKYLEETLDYEYNYGTLVLFFNRNQLITSYNAIPKSIQKNILMQENYVSKIQLLKEHKKRIDLGEPSIIFGLNSFAEGVDLPGLYCMHVIITKLPFESFKDPHSLVLEYWTKYEKGDYFKEISLPEACIRLIQASGRLIRDDNDYGQVSICDNRVVTKNYGRVMLDSLPQFNRKYNAEFLQNAFMKMTTHGTN